MFTERLSINELSLAKVFWKTENMSPIIIICERVILFQHFLWDHETPKIFCEPSLQVRILLAPLASQPPVKTWTGRLSHQGEYWNGIGHEGRPRTYRAQYQFLPPSAASVELKFLSWIDPQGWNILARKPHKYAFILFPIGNPYNPLPEPPYSLFLGLCWINLIKMIKYSNDNRTSLRQLDSTHLDFWNMILISWFLFW